MKLAYCHFCHILLAKANPEASSDSKNSKIDSIVPSLNKKKSHFKGDGFREKWGVITIFAVYHTQISVWKRQLGREKMNQKNNKKKSPIYVLTAMGKDTNSRLLNRSKMKMTSQTIKQSSVL